MFWQHQYCITPSLKPTVEDDLLFVLGKRLMLIPAQFSDRNAIYAHFEHWLAKRYHILHMKYHCQKNMYLTDKRSPQRAVVRAYFRLSPSNYTYCT
eukprot:TRINITY_DN0_c189_g1_i1.p1 TRINITY_DN0_c189_g1~~TRINITY_DN0_c189_g1_i1.p1  ORF type:complete len:96 (-),score=1.25 TRINITY_DN0_c189_g1_i1:39-326(-)